METNPQATGNTFGAEETCTRIWWRTGWSCTVLDGCFIVVLGLCWFRCFFVWLVLPVMYCVLVSLIQSMARDRGMQRAQPGGKQIWSLLNGMVAGMEVCMMIERDFKESVLEGSLERGVEEDERESFWMKAEVRSRRARWYRCKLWCGSSGF